MNTRNRISVTYVQYCQVVTATLEGRELAFEFKIPGQLGKLMVAVKEWVNHLVKDVGASMKDIIKAFTSKDVFKILSAIGFNLGKLFLAFQKVAALAKTGLVAVFHKLEKEGWLDKLKKGAATIDQFLDEYPIVRKLAGPVLGALLIYGLMNGTFIGHFNTDLDLSTALAAFVGHFSIEDLLGTPDGLATLTLIIAGLVTPGGLGITYISSSVYTTMLALLYTGAKKAGLHDLVSKIHDLLKHKVTAAFNLRKGHTMKRLTLKSEMAGEFQQDADDGESFPSGVKLLGALIKMADKWSLASGFQNGTMAHHMSVGLIAYLLNDPRHNQVDVGKFRKAFAKNAKSLEKILTRIAQEAGAE